MLETQALETFCGEIAGHLGERWVTRAAETLVRYGENTMPGGDRPPAAVVYPGSTEDVQRIVAAANRLGVPLYPISTGNNIGLGSRSSPRPSHVVVDLGERMNRIVEIEEALAYAVVEPGVSFQMMHDELARRGNRLMLSVTSGPPHGGLIGNALDKGAGYGPMFDHFGMSCGMEIVLGNGEVIRTGDGSLAHDSLPNWHVSKYSFGPILDGLFAQSNYGIVTRMGMWLMPRPPVIRSFHFTFPDDEDLETVIELCRPMKLTNFVPTLFRVANDLYLCGSDEVSPEYKPGSPASISDAGRKDLQRRHGLGSWNVSGAFFGPSAEAIEPMLNRVRQHFGQSPKATYIDHDQALSMPPLAIAINAFSGVPGVGELHLLKWRPPGGGNSWFTPGTPMIGRAANEMQKVGREIYRRHGMDYCVMNVCGARFARGLHVISFNREDPDECRRADACYRELATAIAGMGVSVGRAPIDYYDLHMDMLMPSFRQACDAIKTALDPNGIIAPGRYGMG